jgi:predicted kinase
MQKIIFLKGIPASGKSTWAKEQVAKDNSYVRVNKDELRIILGSESNPCRNEKKVIAERDRIIIDALKNNKNVIVDDTNLNPIHETRVREIAEEFDAEVEIKWFKISAEEAIERDSQRLGRARVGPAVIHRMLNQIKYSK